MPLLFQYFFKVACSLAVVYLFYQLVLRRLTFYGANRWYLLLLPALCFLLPFINISYFLEQQQLAGTKVVHFIPAVIAYTGSYTTPPKIVAPDSSTVWEMALIIFGSGCLLFLLRLVLQYWSFIHVRKNARLLTQGKINIYEVNKSIIPFSFGNAIFINPDLHSEAELKEILRHELVHVKQRHTLDIIWTELLCIFNWYNPVAWLLRDAVRQNLEFIADTNVLESGVDKKQYQYLLLKVIGVPEFRLASPFNFSSLKKRIVMMNKSKSAKSQWLKFLFILPLLVVLLVAFRDAVNRPDAAKENTLTLSGLVVDAITLAPLTGVSLHEVHTHSTTTTDSRGYYSITVRMEQHAVQTKVQISKEGYEKLNSESKIATKKPEGSIGSIEIIGMVTASAGRENGFVQSFPPSGDDPAISAAPGYNEVMKKFKQVKSMQQTQRKLQGLIKDSEKPYWIVDGQSFIVSKGGSWASTDELTDIVYVDGKKLTGEEVNKTIRRSSFTSAGALEREAAKIKYGIEQPVMEIYINKKPAIDTIPPPPPPKALKPNKAQLPDDYKAFLKRNPTVQNLYWRNDSIYIDLKSGGTDRYANSKTDIKKLEQKYGPLPVPPPPPPPLPSKTTVPPEPES